MTTIKIISNPYNRNLSYQVYKPTGVWEDISQDSINSRLRENDAEKIFLPFKVKEIIDTIVNEYYVGDNPVQIMFEGTTDEYDELADVCNDDSLKDKVHLVRSVRILENARDILEHTKNIFETVYPIIKSIIKDDPDITHSLVKVADALEDIIPICIFGNYSAGKSTFINSLIGYEILPSGGDPVTAKIYEIKRSKQVDRAKVSFAYMEVQYELLFDNNECRILKGDRDKDLIKEIIDGIEKIEDISLFSMINATIDIINSFEKRDRSVNLISNIIEIDVPFCDNGILGRSHNNFVIFDTPGSNSNTNMNHEKVLKDSLKDFSNGIPIWVSGYESIDSTDNAHLCNMLYEIEALDKRFTMIVVNKADSAELPKTGFTPDNIRDIMEYEAVEKMYSSGIYFVSAVMGLGAKNIEGVVSEFLLDVFEEKERKFSDPNARLYKKLYEYNIMPEQMKRNAISYSLACENLIYANSGLLCIEMEMEKFASKHAAYNKCQMVYMFLSGIIDETARRISDKTALLKKQQDKLEKDLDEKKYDLIESIRKDSQVSVRGYERDSKTFIKGFVKQQLIYERTADDLEKTDQKIADEKEQDAGYEHYERDYEGAKSNRRSNLAENGRNLFKGSFVTNIKKLATDWVSDSQSVQQKRESRDNTRQEVDKETSDQLMRSVVAEFRRNIEDAQNRLWEAAKKYWQDNAQSYRNAMIRLITGSDALSQKQRTELSDVILSYPIFEYDDGADKVFIKAKFLRGNVLGLKIGASERLNTSRLASSYNSRIKHSIEEMSEMVNSSCFTGFKEWQEKLQTIIEENITL